MKNLEGFICPLCLDYYAKPLTTICGHSFCEYCLEQYFLHFHTCPVCQLPIRKQKLYRSNALTNFIENFIKSQHQQYAQQYEKQMQKLFKYKCGKMLKEFGAGQMVDIRDENYIWRIGRIIRVISRVGETHKYIKIQYLDCEQKIEEELKVNSERVAEKGFYTSRKDLPKFKEEKHRDKSQYQDEEKTNKKVDLLTTYVIYN